MSMLAHFICDTKTEAFISILGELKNKFQISNNKYLVLVFCDFL